MNRDSFLSDDSAIGSESVQVCHVCQLRRSSRLVDSKDASHVRKQSKPVEEWDIHNICHRLGKDWIPLARQLGFKQEQIVTFAEMESPTERANAMLNSYIRNKGREATIRCLTRALRDEKVGRSDIAEILQGEQEYASILQPLDLSLKIGTLINQNVRYTVYQTNEGGFFIHLERISECTEECQNLTITNNDPSNPENLADIAVKFSKHEENKDDDSEYMLVKEMKESLKQYEEDFKQHYQELYHLPCEGATEEARKSKRLLQKLLACFDQLKNKEALCDPAGDNFGVNAKTYEEYINLANHLKELQDKVEMQKKVAEEEIKEQTEAAQLLGTILNKCESLGKDVEKYQNLYQSLLQQNTKPERTQSEPTRKRSHVPGTMRPNSSIESETTGNGLPSPRNKPEEHKEV